MAIGLQAIELKEQILNLRLILYKRKTSTVSLDGIGYKSGTTQSK